jgi:hypothetical protein
MRLLSLIDNVTKILIRPLFCNWRRLLAENGHLPIGDEQQQRLMRNMSALSGGRKPIKPTAALGGCFFQKPCLPTYKHIYICISLKCYIGRQLPQLSAV